MILSTPFLTAKSLLFKFVMLIRTSKSPFTFTTVEDTAASTSALPSLPLLREQMEEQDADASEAVPPPRTAAAAGAAGAPVHFPPLPVLARQGAEGWVAAESGSEFDSSSARRSHVDRL